MLTDPDAAYLRRIADLLPGKHADRARNIARDIELFLTRVEDSLWTIDHADADPERKLAEVRELLSQCLVAEDTRVESEEAAPVAGAVGRYVRRPVVDEAMQFDGSEACLDAIERWAEDALLTVSADGQLHIDTVECLVGAQPGEWIVRDVQGEYYTYKPNTFRSLYEPAPDPAQEA